MQIIVNWQEKVFYEANGASITDKLQYKTSFTSFLLNDWNAMSSMYKEKLKKCWAFLVQYLKDPSEIE